MKKLLVIAVTLAALGGGAANAADLPNIKGPPIFAQPPASPTWTGFYLGANAGYTWGADPVSSTGAAVYANPIDPVGAGAIAGGLAALGTYSLPMSNGGFIGGGQIGYNFQFASSFVAGIEADIQGIDEDRGTTTRAAATSLAPFGFPAESYSGTVTAARSLDYLGTVRGRLGFLVMPNLLAYATGGLAYGGVHVRNSISAQEFVGTVIYPPISSNNDFSSTRAGWAAGAGLEWMLAPHWSLKAEYLYYNLGSVTYSGSATQTGTFIAGAAYGTASYRYSTSFSDNLVRVGVNYHF